MTDEQPHDWVFGFEGTQSSAGPKVSAEAAEVIHRLREIVKSSTDGRVPQPYRDEFVALVRRLVSLGMDLADIADLTSTRLAALERISRMDE